MGRNTVKFSERCLSHHNPLVAEHMGMKTAEENFLRKNQFSQFLAPYNNDKRMFYKEDLTNRRFSPFLILPILNLALSLSFHLLSLVMLRANDSFGLLRMLESKNPLTGEGNGEKSNKNDVKSSAGCDRHKEVKPQGGIAEA